MITTFKKNLSRSAAALLAVLFFFSSCQKNIDDTLPDIPGTITPDLSTKVSSSVSGFVTDENNAAVLGASVKVGTVTTSTDKYGYFEVRNTDVVKNAATVTVTKAGYFKGIKTYIATAGKAAFFRIKLIPNTTAGTINAATGGNVTLTNGLIVSLPANAVVNAATSAAYSGTINVAAYWINPTATDLNNIMPGDLRALNTAGALKSLTTYGMAAVELTGAGGELLQIATGKKATLTFPVPASLNGTAPASIPLWYFDEAIGLWKEEGSAAKTGNTYVGEVSHFSFWNCDVPNNYVQFNCTIVDADGNPIQYAGVKISVVSNPQNAGWGYTDSTGYVAGAVPDNANLLLEVFSYYSCGTPVYTQTFSTTNTNVSLGTITVNTISATANISGTVTDCNNALVSNGAVLMLSNNQYTRYPLNSNGSFDFNILLCGTNSMNAQFIAEDYTGGQQSPAVPFTVNTGSNPIGNLQACGVQIDQFINITAGTDVFNYAAPADSMGYSVNPQVTPPVISIYGVRTIAGPPPTTSYSTFSFTQTGIAAGSTQSLTAISTNPNTSIQYIINTPINVNITEYGAIGEFVGGNFSGPVTIAGTTNTVNISCNFRIRRTQ